MSHPPSTRPRRRRARGISLIEVLVVLVLFSFGLIGMTTLQARAIKDAISAEDMGRAALLANELAAQMWAADTVSLPAATVTAWTARVAAAAQSGLPNGTATVVVAANTARITIRWRPPGVAVGAESRYVTDVLIPAGGP